MRPLVLAVLLPVLAGCVAAGPAIATLTTAGVAGSVGAGTGSAALAIATGFAVSYGAEQGVEYVERRIAAQTQTAIAAAAAPLADGHSTGWQVAKRLPFGDNAGTVEVARSFGDKIPCKEIVFTVAGDHDVYTSTICRNDQGAWRWALGDPSVNRWGYLQ